MLPRMVNIFADASHCPHTNAAGWAAWMRSGDAEPLFVSGQLTEEATTSNEAEICAIANGLHNAKIHGFLLRGDNVMIQSDSQKALQIILASAPRVYYSAAQTPEQIQLGRRNLRNLPARRPATSDLEDRALGYVVDVGEEFRLTYLLRHVSAHAPRGDGNKRTYINNRCDELARGHMLAGRRRIQYEEHRRRKYGHAG